VRMGELAVTGTAAEVLTTIGLGSCVGIVLLDERRRTAGLAHVVFPLAPTDQEIRAPAKFADTAVPALIAAMARLGSLRSALEAVLIGGARMFAFLRAPDLDIGSANVKAVSQALAQAGVPIRDSVTGGCVGRSVRVHATDGVIAVREAGASSRVYTVAQGLFEEISPR